MIINNVDLLVKEDGENLNIRFDPGNIANPKPQELKRTLVIHAPASGSVSGAVDTIKANLKRDNAFAFSAHLVLGRDGKEIVQMIPFRAGANHAQEYNKRSIGLYLEYSGELIKAENEVRLREKFPDIQFVLGTPLGSSRYGNWPLYPKGQLDTLLAIGKALSKKYKITDVVAYDEILQSFLPHPGCAFPIVQFREKLLGVNDRSMVLQEMARAVPLLNRPGKSGVPLSNSRVPKAMPVSVVNEKDEWFLVSVIGEVDGNPWLIGWVPKAAVRVTTNFIPVVRKDHYLSTSKKRRFQEIAPHKNGFEEKPLMEGPKAPKYIIMHFTTGTKMESTINHFKDPASRVSTHLLIGRDGRVIQFLPFNKIAHHSGYSWWEQKSNLNECSIGIELDNAGLLRKNKDGQWMRRKIIIPDRNVKQAVHWKQFEPKDSKGNPLVEKFPGWEKFPKVQRDVAFKVVQALVKKYKSIKEILGHDDVNLRNRYDPGPVFPMPTFRKKLFGRKDPRIEEYRINRKTDLYGNFEGRLPNTAQATFDVPLPANSLVKVIRREADFALVTVLNSKDPRVKGTGWIQSASLDSENTGGKKGAKAKNKKKKAGESRPEKLRTTISQVFFKRGENMPTPKLDAGPFEFGTRVRIQEFKGEWALVVVLDRVKGQGGLEGWMPKKFLSTKAEFLALTASKKLIAPGLKFSSVPLWQFLPSEGPREAASDSENFDIRMAPDIVILSQGMGRVVLTKEWQLFLVALNPGMKRKHISVLLGTRTAFTNHTGFPGKADDPPRQNWILNENLMDPLPEFDKVRSCAFNYCTGTPSGKHLIVSTLDGNKPPPDITQVNPITHPWFFFHATTVQPKSGGKPEIIRPLSRHGAPAWGVNHNVTFFPLVATHVIRYPLDRLRRLEPSESMVLPYQPPLD